MRSQILGQLLMNLGAEDRHIPRGNKAQLHAIAVDLQDNHFHILANEDFLSRFSAKNQHVPSLRLSPVTLLPSPPKGKQTQYEANSEALSENQGTVKNR